MYGPYPYPPSLYRYRESVMNQAQPYNDHPGSYRYFQHYQRERSRSRDRVHDPYNDGYRVGYSYRHKDNYRSGRSNCDSRPRRSLSAPRTTINNSSVVVSPYCIVRKNIPKEQKVNLNLKKSFTNQKGEDKNEVLVNNKNSRIPDNRNENKISVEQTQNKIQRNKSENETQDLDKCSVREIKETCVNQDQLVIKPFRNIFNSNNCEENVPHVVEHSKESRNIIEEIKERLEPTSVLSPLKQSHEQHTDINKKNKLHGDDTIKDYNVRHKTPETFSPKSKHKFISKYYGESLLEILNDCTINNAEIMLPIVNWSKDSQNLEDVSKCRGNPVGGDGISIELFYKCKYCKMFTTGSQIELHLKSKYHYEKYIEFLRSRMVASESSLNSLSPLSNNSKTDSVSSKKIVQNVKITSHCSEEKTSFDEDELDFNEYISD